jgi:mannosyl-3-phosphoglycerate phosphatase family protein
MKPVVFTDLDGTLLDYSSYSFKEALPALRILKDKKIPLIICSSKTRKEIEYYRKNLGNDHPFISENGGGIFVPKDYFKFDINGSGVPLIEENDYRVVRLGTQYASLRKAITELREEGFRVKGFGDMSVEEVAAAAGLSIEEAEMAKERDFDEPFIFHGDETEARELVAAIKSRGFNVTQGRFFHILGDTDKGKAVSILIGFYKKKFSEIVTIAVGDSPNDISMLEKVDYPIIVRKPDGSYDPRISLPNLIKARGIGPDGWNRAVLRIVLRAYPAAR